MISRFSHPERCSLFGLTVSAVVHGAAFVALSYCAGPVTPAKPPPRLKGEYAIPISLSPRAHTISLSELTDHKSADKEEYEDEEKEPPTPSPPTEIVASSPTVADESLQEPRPPETPPERTEPASLERQKEVETAAEPGPSSPQEPPPPPTPGSREGVRLVGKLSPHYPKRCRRFRHAGTVRLEVEVAASGHVTSVRILASTGCKELDQSAVTAVRTARFQPARLGAQPIVSKVILPIVFRLK